MVQRPSRSGNVSVIEPKSGRAYEVRQGQILRVTDLEGAQIADLVCFDAHDYAHCFSQARSRSNNQTVRLGVGHSLYSNEHKRMFDIVSDTVGIHDLLYPACNSYLYENAFHVGPRNGCAENLAAALEPFDIDPRTIPDPFNIFMNTRVNDEHCMEILHPVSQAGDYVELRARMDCLVAISSCAEDITDANGRACTPMGVEVLDT